MRFVTLLALAACAAPVVEAEPPAPNALDALEAIETPPPSPAFILINEVMSDNDSTVPGADGGYGDWVEIINVGAAPFDLKRATIEEGGALWRGVGTLPPGERALIQGVATDGAPLTIGADGDTVTLLVDGLVADTAELPALDDDVSWARIPDGAGEFRRTARPTPGLDNGSDATRGDGTDALFQDVWITDVDLTPGADGIAALRVDPRTEVPAGFALGGTRFDVVGMRIKGGWGSTREIDQKASIRVGLDSFENHELRGLETLTFNNLVQDASYVHESLAYELFRAAGVPAPRVGWARLWINGQLHGLMTLIETVDTRFLARWFEDPSGTMYEGAYGSDFRPGESWNFELDEGEDDRAALEEIAEIVNGRPTDERMAELEARFDMANLRTVMAVEALSLHWDGYTTSNNYRIYRDPSTGRFSMIPWGTDQTFIDIWYGPWDGGGILFRFCLAHRRCAREYDRELVRVAQLMDALPLHGRLDRRAAWLRADIEADPRREFDVGTHDWALDATRYVLDTWPGEVRRMIAQRAP